MPSVSKAQQSLMGQAYGIKTGSLKPSDLNPKYKDQIVSLAKNMTKKELDKFASTKRKGLPQYVEEDEVTEKNGISTITPLVNITGAEEYTPQGPAGIKPYLDTDAKKKTKGQKNLSNLKDYRDWLSGKSSL